MQNNGSICFDEIFRITGKGTVQVAVAADAVGDIAVGMEGCFWGCFFCRVFFPLSLCPDITNENNTLTPNSLENIKFKLQYREPDILPLSLLVLVHIFLNCLMKF